MASLLLTLIQKVPHALLLVVLATAFVPVILHSTSEAESITATKYQLGAENQNDKNLGLHRQMHQFLHSSFNEN